jgi:hypothetical protein
MILKFMLDGMDWVELAQDTDQRRTLSNMVHGKPSGSIKFWRILECLKDRRPQKKDSAPRRFVRKFTDIFRCQPMSNFIFSGIIALKLRKELSWVYDISTNGVPLRQLTEYVEQMRGNK